jgi:hypothetical protein
MTLLDTYSSLTVSELNSWMTSRRQEDLHLDFKLLAAAPDLNRDDRKNLAKATSGFANSDGGLIVWGIDSRKDDAGVDAAILTNPMPNVLAIVSRLQALTGEATSPIVEGVQHRAVAEPGQSAGYVVTVVPSSEAGPHMARMAEGRYFKRSGDSFYPMEHFDIADMFGRRAHPRLEVMLTPGTGGTSSSMGKRSAIAQARISVVNRGRGLAKFPYLSLRIPAPFRIARYELDGNGRAGLGLRTQPAQQSEWRTYTGGSNDVVHAGTELPVTLVECEVAETVHELADLRVEYQVAADGIAVTMGEVSVPGAQLLDLARAAMERAFPRSV